MVPCCNVTNLVLAKRAPVVFMYNTTVARDSSTAAGSDVVMDHDGVDRISELLRDYSAPGAAGSVYQEGVRFSATQTQRSGAGRASPAS